MIDRMVEATFRRFLNSFPVVLVTGARQVGKTTLVRELLSDSHDYVLLESPDVRRLALEDPRRFLEQNSAPVIFDEFQLVPELTSYLQGLVDQNRERNGAFILTGSQNFSMMEQVSQSLAGRVGVLNLYGLSSEELPSEALSSDENTLGETMLRGSYPELWRNTELQARDWYSSYVQTYLEKDVRRLANVGDINVFERFLRVCASRSGQVLNKASVAGDVGVSQTTIQRWLSVLEESYIIRLVSPFHRNVSSRLRKSPKLYFLDVGLAAYLMGFREAQSLMNSPQYGALFETLVYGDFVKKNSAHGEVPEHFYLETKSRVGVDFVVERQGQLHLYEVKGAKTFDRSLCDQLVATQGLWPNDVSSCHLIMASDQCLQTSVGGVEVSVIPWHKM